MKLYSKVKVLPEQKDKNRVRLADDVTRKVDRKHTYWLHPTEPVEVPDEVARKLLAQDPNLIDTKPHPECLAQAPEKPEILGGLGSGRTQKENPPATEYSGVINELAEIDLETLEAQQLLDYCGALDLKLPASVKKPETIRAKLIARVEEIVAELEGPGLVE